MNQVEKIYTLFENARKSHKTYSASRYERKEFKDVIKFLLEKEQVKEFELQQKFNELGLSNAFYKIFMAIMRKTLGFVAYGEDENGYKVIRITQKLKDALLEENNIESENKDFDFEYLVFKYEEHLKSYFRDIITKMDLEETVKIRLSLRDMSSIFGELIDFALENIDNFYTVLDYLTKLFNEVYESIYGEIGNYKVVFTDFPSIYKIDLNELGAEHLNKVVEFDASVIYASDVKIIPKKSLFRCPECSQTKEVYFRDIFPNIKVICPKCNKPMEFVDELEYGNFQELIVQGMPDSEGYIREQKVLYELCRPSEKVSGGNVRITGIVRHIRKDKQKIYDIIIQAIDIQKIDDISIKLS